MEKEMVGVAGRLSERLIDAETTNDVDEILVSYLCDMVQSDLVFISKKSDGGLTLLESNPSNVAIPHW
jgi:hypothetical protein